jgi:ABC-2 type transport system ATP-binding protein
MKVGDQALFFARLKGLSKKDATIRLKEWFERFGISDWWGKKVEELSKGMAQKIQFIITVLHQPKLLIFDEPFSGFDPINANQMKEEILRLRDNGSTIIFSTHNMSSVEEICDHITLINKSRNILSGKVSDIRNQFAQNQYTLTFNGDATLLSQSISPLFENINLSEIDNGCSKMDIKLSSTATLRDLIGIANEKVEIRSINERIPSMNDIFIQTVEANNK